MQWIGARNPVRTRSSCAAVTGYDFPRANRFGGEGGKKVRPKAFGPKARSQNIRPVQLIRVSACADDSEKLLRKKKNESWAMRPAIAGQTSPTLGVGGNLLCEIAHYVF